MIRLDAFVISGCSSPIPAQNNFIPPPEPVDSITGVLFPEPRPYSSATTVAKGNTVDDPTIEIVSRASALPVGSRNRTLNITNKKYLKILIF